MSDDGAAGEESAATIVNAESAGDNDAASTSAPAAATAATAIQSGSLGARGSVGGRRRSSVRPAARFSLSAVPDAVTKTGWLIKRGHLIKNWKKRWFVLEDGVLSYYVDSSLAKKKGEYSLLGTHMEVEPRPEEETAEVEQHIFDLHVGGHCEAVRARSLIMNAETDAEMNDWMNALKAAWVGPVGDTMAMVAAREGDHDGLMRYLQLGLDCTLQNNMGETAMMLAAAGGHVRVMGTLQSFGAQLDTQTLSGNTALMQAVREEQPAALKYILDRSTVDDVNVMADDGSTALSVAVNGSRPQDVRLLIQSGAEVNVHDNRGWTPLMVATRANNLDMMAVLIEQDAELDAVQPSTGNSAAFFAAAEGHNDALKLLVESGASLHVRNHLNKSILNAAEINNNDEAVEMLTKGITVFSQHPVAEQTVNQGDTVSFQAEAKGSPAPTFRWRKDGEILDENAPGIRVENTKDDATGVGRTTLYVTAHEESDGLYVCLGMNETGTVLSKISKLVLATPPVITQQPFDTVVDPGKQAELEVHAEAVPPAQFQWFKGGVKMPGATDAKLTLEQAQQADTAEYYVVAFNSAGTVQSKPVTISVNVPPFERGRPTMRVAKVRIKVGPIGGIPQPKVQWFQDADKMLSKTSDEIVVNPHITGAYSCEATNSAGAITINAFEFPRSSDRELVELIKAKSRADIRD